MRPLLTSRARWVHELLAVVGRVFVRKVVFTDVTTFAKARSNGLDERAVVSNASAFGGSHYRGRRRTALLAPGLAFLIVELTNRTRDACRIRSSREKVVVRADWTCDCFS